MNGKCELGMIGLGVMGRNLLLNMADHHYRVAGYDRDAGKVALLGGYGPNIQTFDNVGDFIVALREPRVVMILVPAGPPVDSVIHDLLPHLTPGDCIVDGGNSFFKDTDLRQRTLAERDIHFLGVGVSGGEEGARHGPSMMPGGPRQAWERVRPIFEAVAAQVDGKPCVNYMGQGSAGHFVKMVHNGIEYGIMRLIADAYDLMKRGMNLNDGELSAVFDQWNGTNLRGFLVEITARIFRKADEKTGKLLVDGILDVARQKGTGMWTSQTAMELHTPVPNIDIAVAMRDLSTLKTERVTASALLSSPATRFDGDKEALLMQLHHALYAGMLITFAQGMALLHVASRSYGYDLNLESVARIWRGGCIIRSALLDLIAAAFRARPDLPNLLLDPAIATELFTWEADFRSVVCVAASQGIPVPGLMSALGYYDSYRSAWLPANLIEAQRDFFGAHGYERIDEKGTFHTEWTND